MKKFCLMAFALLLTAGTARADNVVVDWNKQAGQTIGAGARRGPSGIFDFAMVHAAVHDAIQAFDRKYKPYCAAIDKKGSKIAAAAAAAHGVLKGLFPSQGGALDTAYAASLAKYGMTGNVGVEVGELAAQCVLERLPADNAARATPDSFMGGNAVGEWRPTSFNPTTGNPVPMTADFIATLKPFTLTDPAPFRRVPGPPALTSRAYAKAYDEVKRLGAKTDSERTQEQTNIGTFFSDSPVGYWNRTMQRLAVDRTLSLGESGRLFALVNLAIADSLIVAWDSKIHFNFWRPSTAIHDGHLDGNPRTEGDASWEPLFANPNYPDYTSGANNAAGSAATMLALFFGSDRVNFTLDSVAAGLAPPANVRSYSRFSAAGRDVIDARIYMGIHFRFADTDAYFQGAAVAIHAYLKFLRPTRGHWDWD